MSSRPTLGADGGLDCTNLRSAGFRPVARSSPIGHRSRPTTPLPERRELITITLEATALADRVAAVPATTIADLSARFRAGPDISKDAALSAQAPAVVWRLDPGETTTTTGTFSDNDGFTTCSVAGSVFVTDTDGLTGDPNPPATVTGQPAVCWFCALLERQADHEAAPSPDAVSRFEDLQRDGPSVAADDDQHGDATARRFGVFRRGADGVWGWLGPALVFRAGLDSCEDYYSVDQ